MRSRSKRGESVRQYFIDMELALYKYKDYIVDGLNTKIEQLENNQKPKNYPNKGIIYVLQALNTENTSLYKIGRTINSKSRFNSHNSPLANDLKVIMIYETENVKQTEACLKNFMREAKYRKYKEIYEIDLNILRKIVKKCDADVKEINEKIRTSQRQMKGGTCKLYAYIPNNE